MVKSVTEVTEYSCLGLIIILEKDWQKLYSGSAVVLTNCEIKKGHYGDDYEVSIQGLGHLTFMYAVF